jgi:hypothetical protein
MFNYFKFFFLKEITRLCLFSAVLGTLTYFIYSTNNQNGSLLANLVTLFVWFIFFLAGSFILNFVTWFSYLKNGDYDFDEDYKNMSLSYEKFRNETKLKF